MVPSHDMALCEIMSDTKRKNVLVVELSVCSTGNWTCHRVATDVGPVLIH